LPDQISELLALEPHLDFAKVLPEYDTLQEQVSNEVSIETIDPWDFSTVSLAHRKESDSITKFMRLSILTVSVLQARMNKEHIQKVIVQLVYSYTLSIRLPSDQSLLRNIFDQSIRTFCTDTLWRYLCDASDDSVDAVLAPLFKLSYSKGGLYTISVATLMEKIQQRAHFDLAIATQYILNQRSTIDTVS
jgi:hypothetical protein